MSLDKSQIGLEDLEEITNDHIEDSYDEEEDPWKDARDVVKNYMGREICLYTELRFARTLWKKACLDFDDDAPPDPLTWLTNGPQMIQNWERFKIEQVGIIEHEDTPEEEREVVKKVLKTSIAVYMDLMASIYQVFIKLDDETIESLKIENV